MSTIDPASTSTVRPTASPLPVLEVAEMAELSPALLERGVDAAIWARATPCGVHRWLDQVSTDAWPRGRFVLSPSDVAACVADLFSKTGAQTSPALAWLSEDVQRLAHFIRDFTGMPKVRLRLEPVFDNACAKFHIDNVTLRLICTYFGPGTEISSTPDHPMQLKAFKPAHPFC